MREEIIILGLSGRPPHRAHQELARGLTRFGKVIVVPCGPRPDKPSCEITPLPDVAAMADLTFGHIPGVVVDLFDLEKSSYTLTHQLDRRYRTLSPEARIRHAFGSDPFVGGRNGASQIQREWVHGKEIWRKLDFIVIERPGYSIEAADLPPHSTIFQASDLDISSTEIRDRVFRAAPVDDLVTPEVAAYIKRHGTYRGTPSSLSMQMRLEQPRLFLAVDERNPRAQKAAGWLREIASQLGSRITIVESPAECDEIVSIGGDGQLLHTVKATWRKRKPYFGINTGTVGYLLNDIANVLNDERFCQPQMVYSSPLLYAEVMIRDGETKTGYAFNDCWVQAGLGQTAWIQVTAKSNGRTWKEHVVGDGLLLATAAGSTAYAKAIGAMPQLMGTPMLVMAGSNVSSPSDWQHLPWPVDTVIEFKSSDPTGGEKRPLFGFIDGVPQGEIVSMRIRASQIATAEIAFLPPYRPEIKLPILTQRAGRAKKRG